MGGRSVQPSRRGDRLIARGAVDMKGFVAAVLGGRAALVRLASRAPVHIALSYDEEAGCRGVPHLIDKLLTLCAPPLGCIVGEPSGLVPVLRHKGKAALRVTARGHFRPQFASGSGFERDPCSPAGLQAVAAEAMAQSRQGPGDLISSRPTAPFRSARSRAGRRSTSSRPMQRGDRGARHCRCRSSRIARTGVAGGCRSRGPVCGSHRQLSAARPRRGAPARRPCREASGQRALSGRQLRNRSGPFPGCRHSFDRLRARGHRAAPTSRRNTSPRAELDGAHAMVLRLGAALRVGPHAHETAVRPGRLATWHKLRLRTGRAAGNVTRRRSSDSNSSRRALALEDGLSSRRRACYGPI